MANVRFTATFLKARATRELKNLRTRSLATTVTAIANIRPVAGPLLAPFEWLGAIRADFRGETVLDLCDSL